ncbi:MAG: hypothetical protein EPN72_06405 [Nevskiaceae bacterium]|nr:MAG: hypothetical protein EPN63_10105 [Nevskiaceae bacterium]TBR73418.1 MAG: hypothetical protein EPN72_06405 [Nevskiaceae bacterium]
MMILGLHLLPALLGGLAVFELVAVLEKSLRFTALAPGRTRALAIALLAAVVIALLILAGMGSASLLRHGSTAAPALLTKLADALAQIQPSLPAWIGEYLPTNAAALRDMLGNLLSTHSSSLSSAGREIGRVTAQILIGMVLGGLLALHRSVATRTPGPLAAAVVHASARFAIAFRRVILAQGWIALVNACFTALYLLVALPLAGVHLPLAKTLVVLTFIIGLLPIVGNLISNTLIVAISFTISLGVAIASLVFLIAIHKLEYFLNAKIIGSHIRAQAWELLLAMLVMEAAFGLPGIVAAPIYYAYFKRELRNARLI